MFMFGLIGNKNKPNNIGLYRDDGLASFKYTNKHATGKTCLRAMG